VLILDEPTAGVDVELRTQLWEYVRKLNKAGTTVLLTTHYLEEAEELCDEIAVINHGEVVACDKKTNLLRSFDSKQLVITPAQKLPAVPAALQQLTAHLDEEGRLLISYKPSKAAIQDILDAVKAAGVVVQDISTREADLEDIFIHLTTNKAA
jgi:ABC-2 type transport system ATP-binding protein